MTDSAEPLSSEEPAKKASPSKRGVGFPSVTLPAAVEIVRKAGQHGGDHSLTAFAGYAGHTTPNSGPFKAKLAALKDWRLVSSNGDRVFLTELGKDFALAESPMDEMDHLRESYLGCRIFKQFYDDTAKGIPQKTEQLERRAGLTYGVSAASKEVFVNSLVVSAIAAGLAEAGDDNQTVTFLSVQAASDDESDEQVDDDHPTEVNTRTLSRQRKSSATEDNLQTAVVRQAWPIDGGEVILSVNSSRPIPADAFALIGEAVTAASKLADRLGGAGTEQGRDDATA
jgi:hypothetical protein